MYRLFFLSLILFTASCSLFQPKPAVIVPPVPQPHYPVVIKKAPPSSVKEESPVVIVHEDIPEKKKCTSTQVYFGIIKQDTHDC